MRGVLIALTALVACSDHRGVAVLVTPSDGVEWIRLYVGVGDVTNHDLTIDTKAQAMRADYWSRDPGNATDVVAVAGAARVDFGFTTTDSIPVVIAVGYDADKKPIAAAVLHDLAPSDTSNNFAGYEVGLTPSAALGKGSPMDLALWSPPQPQPTAPFDAACVGVQVPDMDHPSFVVIDQDQDCDGLPDGSDKECDENFYLGMALADADATTCMKIDSSECKLGGSTCTDGVGPTDNSCVAGHICAQSTTCDICMRGSPEAQYACAADVYGAGNIAVNTVNTSHYECTVTVVNGQVCPTVFTLDRPPTGGYDCKDLVVGTAAAKLAGQVTLGNGIRLDAAVHDGPALSCQATLKVSGAGTMAPFSALAAFTLENDAGVAMPITFDVDGSKTTCPADATASCDLSDSAFLDPTFTSCAAKWLPGARITDLALTTTAQITSPTLNKTMTEMFFLRDSVVLRTTRGSTSDPWSVPQPAFTLPTNPVITPTQIELSPDGKQLLVTDPNAAPPGLFMFTRNNPTDSFTPASLKIFTQAGTGITSIRSATFATTNHLIATGSGPATVGFWDLTYDATYKIATVTDIVVAEAIGVENVHASADGLHLYFEGMTGPGSAAVFVASRRTPNEPFEHAVPIDELEPDLMFSGNPWVSDDHQTMFYVRDTPMGLRLFSTTRGDY